VKNTHKRLARGIRRHAKTQQIALTHLADRAPVARSQLFRVLDCESSPTIEWLEKIAAVLKVEVRDLL
jgi:DNA-binding phage protein